MRLRGLIVMVVSCAAPEATAPPPIVARSTETLPEEPPPKAPPPESIHPSAASLFADEPKERGRRRRRRRRRRVQTSLVGPSARDESEEAVRLRHRVSGGGGGDAVDPETLDIIAQNSRAIAHCVADAARRGERTTGKMEIEVEVDGRGRVRATRLLSEAYVGSILGACVLRRVKEWRFAATGQRATLLLPFVVEAAP